MHTHDNTKSMDQKIFNIGLSMETVSLYLLCCGLSDAGSTISKKNILEIWNGGEEELRDCLQTLEEKNIILRILSDGEEHDVYKLVGVEQWKTGFITPSNA
ncbi:MAG: hypothetical protein JRF60_18765 [Deltaproteobacteria bacterium]|nr:hypothetical protein [Deltaproteobacteria bacterium]MBW2563953.1 hypothetical protein [Deltaproteobacteria bacterium]